MEAHHRFSSIAAATAVRWACCLAIVLSLHALGADAPNLARNASFEQGKAGRPSAWTFGNSAQNTTTGTWDNAVAHTGKRSLRLDCAKATGHGEWATRWTGRPPSWGFLSATPSTIYLVSVWGKAKDLTGRGPTLAAGFYDAKGEYIEGTGVLSDPLPETAEWRKLAMAVIAPVGAAFLDVRFKLWGGGTCWYDDVEVVTLSDASQVPASMRRPARVKIGAVEPRTPAGPDSRMRFTLNVQNPDIVPAELTLQWEVLDYWFRHAGGVEKATLPANGAKEIALDVPTVMVRRLYEANYRAAARRYRIQANLSQGSKLLCQTVRDFTMRLIPHKRPPLPPLDTKTVEDVGEPFGKLELVDVVRCYDANDPHPYMEGGRGMGTKSTSGPIGWARSYRFDGDAFTEVREILGKPCRVGKGWGWFAYRLGRGKIDPGESYLTVLDYPEDTARTLNIVNTASYDPQGFHTGRTLGDHWTRQRFVERVDFPLSGRYEKWHCLFTVKPKVWAPDGRYHSHYDNAPPGDGFWFFVMGVGQDGDPLANGCAAREIRLYRIDDMSRFRLQVEPLPPGLPARQIIETSEATCGVGSSHMDWEKGLAARAQVLGYTGIAPNLANFYDVRDRQEICQLFCDAVKGTDLGIYPRFSMGLLALRAMDRLPAEALAVRANGDPVFHGLHATWSHLTRLPDLVHPKTAPAYCRVLDDILGRHALDQPRIRGVYLLVRANSLPISYSDYDLAQFSRECLVRIPAGTTAERARWVVEHEDALYQLWWQRKKRDFLLALRDHVRGYGLGLEFLFFNWGTDDSLPFGQRLRYVGMPQDDYVEVPGTGRVLEPQMTPASGGYRRTEESSPILKRKYYRDVPAPDRKPFVDLPALWLSGLAMDVRRLPSPGVLGPLFHDDVGIKLLCPIHYHYTASRGDYLRFFRTGDGLAIINQFPYNEETAHANCPNLHFAGTVEHPREFSLMEEVLAMAHGDPVTIVESAWTPLNRGWPRAAREFAAAYRALPALPSVVLPDAADSSDVVVRRCDTAYGPYVAVVNVGMEAKRVRVKLTAPAAGAASVRDLLRRRPQPFVKLGSHHIAFEVDLPAMSLRSYFVRPTKALVPFAGVQVTPRVFSPNRDGRCDETVICARNLTGQPWSLAIEAEDGHVVRRFAGEGEDLRVAWDGRDVAHGHYHLVFAAAGMRTIASVQVDLEPPAAPRVASDMPSELAANWLVLRGSTEGNRVRVRLNSDPATTVLAAVDGQFECLVRFLNLGVNNIDLSTMDEGGNAAQASWAVTFKMPEVLRLDFGSGPVEEGWIAVDIETAYTPQRGYGWLNYKHWWRGDRVRGGNVKRDYLNCIQDGNEFVIDLPNREYEITNVMGDAQFPHYVAELSAEGRKIYGTGNIPRGEWIERKFRVRVDDGQLNLVWKKGDLPYAICSNGMTIRPVEER